MKHLSLATARGSIIINKKGVYVFDGRPTREKFNGDWKDDYPHLDNHDYIDITVISVDPHFTVNGIPYTEHYCIDGVSITLYCDIGTPQAAVKKAIGQLRHERDIVSLPTINLIPWVWNLDEKRYAPELDKAKKWLADKGYNKGTHKKFKVGQVITFMTGTNTDLHAQATIKGIDGNDLYVYSDCYWFPIRADDTQRKITIVK